jgi:hypothetical protein
MAFEVLRTPQMRDAVQRMSRTDRANYEAARDELGGRGCVAGGYKLAATDGGDYPVCARHLANDRQHYADVAADSQPLAAMRRAVSVVGLSALSSSEQLDLDELERTEHTLRLLADELHEIREDPERSPQATGLVV